MLNMVKVPKLEVNTSQKPGLQPRSLALVAKVVAKVFPHVVCVLHFHISDQILAQTCTVRAGNE